MKKLRQIGPTCGFFCMEYVYSKLTGKKWDKKRIVDNIESAVNEKKSYVGEIFDIDTFLDLFKEMYPDVHAEIKRVREPEDLDVKGKRLIVVPVRLRDNPHFMVVENDNGNLKCYNPDDGKITPIDTSQLYEYNLDIKPYFKWKNYFKDYEKFKLSTWIDNKSKEIVYMHGTNIAAKIKKIKDTAEKKFFEKKMPKESYIKLKTYYLDFSR